MNRNKKNLPKWKDLQNIRYKIIKDIQMWQLLLFFNENDSIIYLKFPWRIVYIYLLFFMEITKDLPNTLYAINIMKYLMTISTIALVTFI